MADKETKKATKPKLTKKEPSHPKYSEMVTSAITTLKERTGSSRQAILKYIVSTYNLDEKVASIHVKVALIRGVVKGLLKQVKGTGANGSFRVVKQKPEPKKPKKTVEKKATKHPYIHSSPLLFLSLLSSLLCLPHTSSPIAIHREGIT